jgi:predicted MPP superfamily phosphohydrolase
LRRKKNKKVFDPSTPKYNFKYGNLKKFFIKFVIGLLLCELIPLLLFPFSIGFFILFSEISLPIRIFAVLFAFLITSYFVYLIFIKYNKINITNYVLYSNKIKKDFKFVFLSDLHIGQKRYATNRLRLKKIISLINSLDSDIVLFAGDFIDEELCEDILIELKDIKQNYKIGVFGNHDAHYLYLHKIYSIPIDVVNIIEQQGIKILINSGIIIGDVYIYGVADLWSNKVDFSNIDKDLINSKYSILLSHNPDIVDDVLRNELNFDLILSGHNHSGQVDLLFLKFPVPSKYQWLRKGIYSISSNTKLLLTQGVGHSVTRIRIGTCSEICLVKIEVK